MAALIAEEMQQLIDSLDDPELKAIAQWKLEGYTNEEIAAKLKCVPRTVERRMQDIRKRLDEIRMRWLEWSAAAEAPDSARNAEQAGGAMQVVLRVTAGPSKGRSFTFFGHDMFIVGRSKDAHFRLPPTDRYVSRVHFLVEINPPHCRLVDMKSRHGTRVNGQKVQHVDLKDGDKIQAGKTLFRVEIRVATGDPEQTKPYPPPKPSTAQKPADVPIAKPARLSGPSPVTPLPQGEGKGVKVCPACSKKPVDHGVCPACADLGNDLAQPFADYRILRELGRGGMGIVYLAIRKADGVAVALKQIRPAVAGTRGQLERFLREAAILKTLHHPNIVAFTDMGRGGDAGELIFFAMEYVTGVNGDQLLRQEKVLKIPCAVGIVCLLLTALDYAHAKGFVHRDIKPGNILIQQGNRVKLADFGLARVYQESALSGLTLVGEVGGTMAYMAPEQIINYRQAKPAVDQYSSAATLYRLLTGAWIFDLPKRIEDQLPIVLEEIPRPIQQRRPDVPDDLAAIILKALAKNPSARFADVSALREALAPFAES